MLLTGSIIICKNTDGVLWLSDWFSLPRCKLPDLSPPLSVSFVVVADGLAHKASHCCHAAIATRIYLPPSEE